VRKSKVILMGLRIGEVATRAGVNLQTIRYYEREGLLVAPPRTPSGYRIFPNNAVVRVRFIKRAQELGFSLREIRGLLSLPAIAGAEQVRALARAKIADIEEKMRTLEVMKNTLTALADRCPGCGPLSECPILDALEARGESSRELETDVITLTRHRSLAPAEGCMSGLLARVCWAALSVNSGCPCSFSAVSSPSMIVPGAGSLARWQSLETSFRCHDERTK
jgi:MerR family mercuric resistance operon transcriptional regulator